MEVNKKLNELENCFPNSKRITSDGKDIRECYVERYDSGGKAVEVGDKWVNHAGNVERLLNKRVIRKGRGLATEYLLRWKGYGPEFDRWYNLKDLQDALELVEEYEEEARRMSPAIPPSSTSASPLLSTGPSTAGIILLAMI